MVTAPLAGAAKLEDLLTVFIVAHVIRGGRWVPA